ncbi:MAG: hypothetical protein M0T80_02675 [Actinomycetota bacterium]|nr:hypothetical protein [Actinomycetota bacterium]
MNPALLIVRGPLGLALGGHGIQEPPEHFGGHGSAAEGAGLEAHGLGGDQPVAALSVLTQLAAGISIATGLLSSLGSAAAIGVVLVATTTKVADGLWVQVRRPPGPLVC